jgi:hypothetical protein
MGQVLHGRHNDKGNPSSNTNSQESLRALTKALLDQSEDRSLFLGLGVKLSNEDLKRPIPAISNAPESKKQTPAQSLRGLFTDD